LGGVSGHAGLFSTVEDLSKFAMCYLKGGTFQNKQLLSTNSILQMSTNQTPTLNKDRGIGWEIYESGNSSFAGEFKTDSFGHTGFTGTSLVLNLSSNFFVILLTNRIHYGRRDDIMYIRKNVHRMVSKVLDY
jgi:CubicO group peptidase (beta-lactamase class C family)